MHLDSEEHGGASALLPLLATQSHPLSHSRWSIGAAHNPLAAQFFTLSHAPGSSSVQGTRRSLRRACWPPAPPGRCWPSCCWCA